MLGIDGWQDVTNVNQLGRSLHDPERFADFKAEVDKAAESRTSLFEPVSNDASDNELLIGVGLGLAGLLIVLVAR